MPNDSPDRPGRRTDAIAAPADDDTVMDQPGSDRTGGDHGDGGPTTATISSSAPSPSAASADVEGSAGDAITISVVRTVVPGGEGAFESFLEAGRRIVARFPGFIGMRVIAPPRGQRDYRIVIRFDSKGHLHTWWDSDTNAAWRSQVDELTESDPLVTNITGTAQDSRLVLALTPLESFVRTSVSGIGLLLAGTVLAIVLANSPLSGEYERFWGANVTVGASQFGISQSLRDWVNTGLMALFFFVMGLEIKRQLLVGELRYPRQAALPVAAAIGGVIVPALLFSLVNIGGDGRSGWGIPMATDTAFSLGILSLLGTRVRPLLLVFVTAFAIVDDIISVLVIAVFYTDRISWAPLVVAVLLLAVLLLANRAGFHRWPIYGVLGLGVWIAIHASGIHGTIAGILVAMTVPARSWINPSEFLIRGRHLMDDFEAACYIAPSVLSNEPQQQATQALEQLCEQVETPMTHLQHQVNPLVAYAILPIFAFANAGIPVTHGLGAALTSQVTWGVVVGLVLGKPIGILLMSWLAVRVGVALKPPAITWRQLASVGALGGIGFTVSLFVTDLAFGSGAFADHARVGIMIASIVAGIIGYLLLRETLPPARDADGAADGAT